MKNLAFALIGLLAFCGVASATCSGPCVQESSVNVGTSGAAPNPTLGSNTTAGNALIAIESTNSGNSAQSVSGQGATWKTLADSGNSTSTGTRTKIFCGVVVTPGTTITFAGNGNSSGYLMETNKKACNFAGATQVANVGFAASGTSISSFSVTTLSSLPVVIAQVSHRTAEAVTFTQSLTATNTTNSVPTFNGAYGQNSGANSFSASWTTSSANNWAAVAFDDQCSGNDACIQQSAPTNSTGAAANTNTFASSVTPGHIVVITDAMAKGNVTPLVNAATGTDIVVGSWTIVGDSGNSTSSGFREYLLCGVVTKAGTTVVVTPSASANSTITAAEFSGYSCQKDSSVGANTGSSTASSVASGTLTTTHAKDLIVGGLSAGGSSGTITDGSSSGFRIWPTRSALGPNLVNDYQVVSSTGTFSTSYSFGTAVIAATAVTALEKGSPQQIVENDLNFVQVPIPNATPTPTTPNKGIFYKASSGNCPKAGTSFHSNPPSDWGYYVANGYNPQGCFIEYDWSIFEPQEGVFDWSAIDNQLALDNVDNYPIQVEIDAGENGTPNTDVACKANAAGATPCTPWLASSEGVNVHWRVGTNHGAPNEGGIDACAPLIDPSPMDSHYQSALQAFYTAFETKYSGNPRIALVAMNAMGDKGHHMGLTWTGGGIQYCAPWGGSAYNRTAYNNQFYIQPGLNWSTPTPSCIIGTPNTGCFVFHETVATCTRGNTEPNWGLAQTTGNTINDGTCVWQNTGLSKLNEFYNDQWNTIAHTHGCSYGDNTCWENLVVNTFHTIWTNESTTWSDQNLSNWITNQSFPTIAGCTSSGCACVAAQNCTFDQAPNPANGGESAQVGIQNRIFAYANAHQPSSGKYYVTNEAQTNANGWANLVSPWFNGTVTPAASGGLSQMVKAFNGDNGGGGAPNCTDLCAAGVMCGAYKGDIGPQIYGADFSKCNNTAFGNIANAINGTAGITCGVSPNPCP